MIVTYSKTVLTMEKELIKVLDVAPRGAAYK